MAASVVSHWFQALQTQPNNKTKNKKKHLERKNERKDNLQKASSGGREALRLTLTMTGLSFVGFGGAEELSPWLLAI